MRSITGGGAVAAALLATGLLLAGCGGDGEEPTAGGTAPTTDPSVPAAGGSVTPQATVTATGPSPTSPSTSAPSASTPEDSPASATALPAPSAATTQPDDEADLTFEDQSGDGSLVVVQDVQFGTGDGLVVINTATDPTPLGVAAVTAGGAGDLLVFLDPPLTGDTELVATLYTDVDGDGAFDPDVDAAVVDDDGELEQEDIDYTVS